MSLLFFTSLSGSVSSRESSATETFVVHMCLCRYAMISIRTVSSRAEMRRMLIDKNELSIWTTGWVDHYGFRAFSVDRCA
jgi:hypothetical protein